MILWFWVLIALNQTFDVIVSVLHWTRRRSRWRRGPSHPQVSVLFTSHRYLSVLAVPAYSPSLSVCLAAVKMQTGHVWFLIHLWAYFEHAPQQFTFLYEFLACVTSLIGDGRFILFQPFLLQSCYVIIPMLWLLRRMNSYASLKSSKQNCSLLRCLCFGPYAENHLVWVIQQFLEYGAAAKDLPCWCWEGTFYRRAAPGEPTVKLAALENVLGRFVHSTVRTNGTWTVLTEHCHLKMF